MTVTDVITAARDIYNASGDTFFTDLQFYNWITQAQEELATKAWVIEGTTTGVTVASTQDYVYPTNYISIKRVVVNGRKLKPISHRQDDSVTLSNTASTITGQPTYYTDFNDTVSMRPIPDAVYTINWMGYKNATNIAAASDSITVPVKYHFDLVNYCLWRMFSKDKDTENMAAHLSLWRETIKDAISFQRRKKRMDGFATVQNEDNLPANILGEQ